MKIIQQRSIKPHAPKIGECSCGTRVILDQWVNTCGGCGCEFNMSGHQLSPRQQWGNPDNQGNPAHMIGEW